MNNKYSFPKIVIALGFIIMAGKIRAQFLVSNYTFSTSAATYTQLAGGTTLTPTTTPLANSVCDYVPIGFNFNFCGVNSSSVSVSQNGYIKIGAVNYVGSVSDPISGLYNAAVGSGSNDSLVSALGWDLEPRVNGLLSYTTTGISPNRIFTVEWKNYATAGNPSIPGTDNLNFQIKLYETTNIIMVHYGSFTLDVTNGTYASAQVGLRGSTDFINSLIDYNNVSVYNGTNTWATPIAGLGEYETCDLDAGPPQFKPNNRRYVWSPPPPCSGTPNPGSITGSLIDPGSGNSYPADTLCTGMGFTLNVSGQSLASNLTYQWQRSANNTTWTPIFGATSPTLNSVTFNSAFARYYRCVVACGSNTAATASYTITEPNPPIVNTVSDYTAVCPGNYSVNLDVNSLTTGNNIYNIFYTYQWQTSSNGSTWSVVPSQVNPYYNNVGVITNTVYYRVLTSCGTQTSLSIPVIITPITTPNAGTTTAGFNTNALASGTITGCASGQYLAIGLAGASNAAGMTYSLLNSANGATYGTAGSTPFPPPFNQTFYNTIYYEAILACGVNTAVSVPVNIVNTAPGYSYASIPFLENFDNTWQTRCSTNDVPNNTTWMAPSYPTYTITPFLNASWRQQSDGASAGWTSPTTGTIAPLTGAGCANFHSSQAFQAPSSYMNGKLRLLVNLSGSTLKRLSFYYKNPSGSDRLSVYTSTNAGTTFNSSGTYFSGNIDPTNVNWNKKILYLSVNSPSCIIEFYGENQYFGGVNSADDLAIDSLEIKDCIDPISIIASATSVCSGGTVALSATGSASSYTWSTFSIGSAITPSLTVPTVYSVAASNGIPGCTTTQTIAIGIKTINISPSSSVVCSGNSVSLTATGAITYTWSNSATSTVIAINPTSNTNYSVSGDGVGCILSQSISIGVNPNPTVSINTAASSLCIGNSATLTANGAANYSWSVGSQTIASIVINPTITANYSVTGSSALGCIGSAVQAITVNPLPTLSVSPLSSTICNTGGTASLVVSGAANYTWAPNTSNAPSVLVNPTVTTIYSVSTTNTLGCKNTATVNVAVVVCPGIKQNAFTNIITQVFPNPSTGLILVLMETFDADYNFEVFDVIGNLVNATSLLSNETNVDLGYLSNGLYTYRIISSNTRVSIKQGKLIKQ